MGCTDLLPYWGACSRTAPNSRFVTASPTIPPSIPHPRPGHPVSASTPSLIRAPQPLDVPQLRIDNHSLASPSPTTINFARSPTITPPRARLARPPLVPGTKAAPRLAVTIRRRRQSWASGTATARPSRGVQRRRARRVERHAAAILSRSWTRRLPSRQACRILSLARAKPAVDSRRAECARRDSCLLRLPARSICHRSAAGPDRRSTRCALRPRRFVCIPGNSRWRLRRPERRALAAVKQRHRQPPADQPDRLLA